MRFAGDSRLKVVFRTTDRQIGRRIADAGKVVKMAVRMPGLAFRCGAEQRGNFRVALHIGLVCEIQVTTVGLAFTRESGF